MRIGGQGRLRTHRWRNWSPRRLATRTRRVIDFGAGEKPAVTVHSLPARCQYGVLRQKKKRLAFPTSRCCHGSSSQNPSTTCGARTCSARQEQRWIRRAGEVHRAAAHPRYPTKPERENNPTHVSRGERTKDAAPRSQKPQRRACAPTNGYSLTVHSSLGILGRSAL